jgi:predicted ATPase/class 3 adenylate cyclase
MNCPACGHHNPDTANYCANCGRALRPTDRPRSFVEWLRGGVHREAERRQVTILACDTVGSSLLAERMDPEEFLDLMNQAFEAILAPIFRHGGYLARLEGDGFKAFFGAPEAHEDDPLRAVRAGLAIQEVARHIASGLRQARNLPEFAVRVGIHTDYVVVGPVGAGDVVEYTAMGIGIVLAARLESIAQPGTVLVSESTHRLVDPYVEVVPLGPTQVKGRSQPVHVFEVTGMRAEAELDQVLGVRSPLVGRDAELALLRGAVEKLLTGPSSVPDGGGPSSHTGRGGAVVHVVGETGVGKSRLIDHVRNQMTGTHPQLFWLDGRAISQGQGAYGVLADLVRNYLGIGADDRLADMRAKLRRRLVHLFQSSPDQELRPETQLEGEAAELLPHLANLLSLPLEEADARRLSGLDPEAQERGIFRALRRLCERLTDEGPLVLALEDLQGADAGAIRLLQDLLDLMESRPVLFLFSFRPEPGVPCWGLRDLARRAFPEAHVEVPLHSLSSASSDALIDNLLESPGGEGLSESVRALIRDRSGGNPLFIEEVVRSLVDRGMLQRAGSRWQVVQELPTHFVPDTLHGVILARLDRLETGTRHVLQLAAVIGRSFSLRVLQAVVQNGGQLGQHLVQLQRAELIRERRRGGEQEYSFNHALTRQVAYETLLRRQRREYHRRVAEAIERLYADRLEEQFERLAHHYANAEAWAAALDYHIRFANQAQLRFANSKAAEHYRYAWEIVESGQAGDEATRALLHEARANLDLLAGDYGEAARRYEAALTLAASTRHRARLLRKLGNVCQGSGEYEHGIEYLQRGLELLSESDEDPEVAALYAGLGQIYHRQGHYRRATELGLRSLEVFERLSDQPGRALATNLLGIAYWSMGDLDTALAYHEQSMLIHSSLGDVPGLAASYNNLGRVLADQGRLERAMRNFQQSQQLCLEIGYQHGLATALSHMSEVYQQMGHSEESWACQERAFEIYNRIGFDGLDVKPEVLKMQVW